MSRCQRGTALPAFTVYQHSAVSCSWSQHQWRHLERFHCCQNHVIKYCEKVYERSGKDLCWYIKNSNEVLNKLKSIGFCATSLSTYDFSTLYTTFPHNLIKEKLIDLIEWTFQRVNLILPLTKDRLSSFLETPNDINFGHVKTYVKP